MHRVISIKREFKNKNVLHKLIFKFRRSFNNTNKTCLLLLGSFKAEGNVRDHSQKESGELDNTDLEGPIV